MMKIFLEILNQSFWTCASLVLVLLLMLMGPRGFASEGERALEVTSVSADACRTLAAYRGDGSADYQPGIAADGSPVMPADLDAMPVALAPVYSFTVEVMPLKGTNQRFSPETGMTVAQVDVDPVTGHIMINGHEMPGAQAELSQACARLHHIGAK